MRHFTRLLVGDKTIATTPRYFGVNVEIQDHHDQTNLWDWVADLGINCLREFHPEVTLRDQAPAPETWQAINSPQAFDNWRQSIRAGQANPPIQWQAYRFDKSVPWLGVPDEIVRHVTQIDVLPLISLGYRTKHYHRPLVSPVEYVGPVEDSQLDWAAAASAYDYYFAVMHRYASKFGCTHFMMCNEPENRWDWFHLPESIQQLGKQKFWAATSWDDDNPDKPGALYFGVLATQLGVLSRIARAAAEDVQQLVGDKLAEPIQLSGPTTVVWEKLWEFAAAHLDTLDLHHYHTNPSTFAGIMETARQVAGKSQRKLAVSEFNRYSGGTRINDWLFDIDNSLEAASLIMQMMGEGRPAGPAMEFLMFYLLSFPSTHRNYKHLLYGDMNVVDWSGRDTPLWDRDEENYPTFEQLQIRHATPAYFMLRMLARAACGRPTPGPFPVLPVGISNPTSSGPADISDQLVVQAVRQPGCLVVTILNAATQKQPCVVLDLPHEGSEWASAIIRETSRQRQDQVVEVRPMDRGHAQTLSIALPGQSLTQIILTPVDLSKATELRISEQSNTPGELKGLEVLQTTRLRAEVLIDSDWIDITNLAATFTSSQPEVVRVGSTGLVQRLMQSEQNVEVTVRLPGTELSQKVAVQ